MKSFAPYDRPREKLNRYGSSVLGDNELLAVILGHGFHRRECPRHRESRAGDRGG